MLHVFRIRLFCLSATLLIFSLSVFANGETVKPAQFQLNVFIQASLPVLNGNTSMAEAYLNETGKKINKSVCVCEIMELRNNNSQVSNVAVFAETTNYGNMGDEYKKAERLIRKERKLMKQVYYDEIRTQEKLAAATDCLNLYIRLKGYHPDLKLYDILDADHK